jgi:hypothetical protein
VGAAPPLVKDATAAICGRRQQEGKRRRCLTAVGSAAAVCGRRRQGRGAPRCRFLPFFVRREHTRHLGFGKRRKGHVGHFAWLSIKINYNIEFGVLWHNNSDLGCLLAKADFLNGLWQKPHFSRCLLANFAKKKIEYKIFFCKHITHSRLIIDKRIKKCEF